MIASGGTEIISAGGVDSGGQLGGGTQIVLGSAVNISLNLNASAVQTISSGGVAVNVSVSAADSQ